MLLMKNWLETRWRLTAIFVYVGALLAISYRNPQPNEKAVLNLLLGPFLLITSFVLTLAGSGVRTQSSVGFPPGLAESTQFTLALPVSRMKLMAVRLTVGLLETFSVTLTAAALLWTLFPALRASTTPADFARTVLTTLIWLTMPYSAALFFETLLAEPLSFTLAGLSFALLVWCLHHIAPAVDIARAFGQASPLFTHRLPWPQLATMAGLSLLMFMSAVRIVQTREY